MKKTFFILFSVFYSGVLTAQWTTSGSNIYNTNTGFVGIGTTIPTERLELKGHLLVNTGNADGGRVIWRGGTGGTQEYRARVYTDGHLAFYPGETKPTVLALTQNGNVGIGTTNPGTFKLAVEGKIGAREIRVTATNPWPDYVFKPHYNLIISRHQKC
ncbi:MAG: hypothetical protein J0I84_11485 [Terrimonas sp.]|nr:hypothetical protein [Terrimonas sp.]